MAIFIPPKGNNETLSGINLLEGELVYNTDQKQFFTGDGQTRGGFPIVAKISEETLAEYIKKEADPFFAEVSGQYITSSIMNAAIDDAVSEFATTDSLSAYAKKEDVPSIDGLARIDAVNTLIDSAVASLDIPSIEGLATTDSLSAYAKKEDVPSVDGFATKAEVSAAVEDLAKVSDVQEAITEAVDSIEIPSIEGLVTTDSLSAYAKKDEIEEKYATKINSENKINFDLLSGPIITIEGDNIIDDVGTPHLVFTKLSDYSLEMSADNEFSSSKLSNSEYKNKLFTVNIGTVNTVSGFAAFAIGKGNKAIGDYAFAHGYKTFANGAASHAQGHNNNANGSYSHAEGHTTTADGSYSHTEGIGTKAIGNWSHAEGGNAEDGSGGGCIAYGNSSHAEGCGITSGMMSHAEGEYSTANGKFAHAEGGSTQANGHAAHSEGWSSHANGSYSHAEGKNTYSDGEKSHAEGEATHAVGECSHAEGSYMNAIEAYQHVEGKYGKDLTGYQHIVGGGTSENRKNIQTLDWDGNLWNAGNVKAVDFIAGSEKLSNKIDKVEVTKYDLALMQIEKLQKTVDYLLKKSFSIETNVSIYNPQLIETTEENKLVLNDATVDAIVSNQMIYSPIGKTTTVTVKSLDIDNSNISTEKPTGDSSILIDAKEDASITNTTISGNLSSGSNNVIELHSAEVFKLENVTITGNTYNTIMTGQRTGIALPKYINVINCNFNESSRHTNFWIGGWKDGAIINIRNCVFTSAPQTFILGDGGSTAEKANSLIFNIINCDMTSTETDLDWFGFIGMQTLDIKTSVHDKYPDLTTAKEINPFRNVRINLSNVTVNGVKLTKDNFRMGEKGTQNKLWIYLPSWAGDGVNFDDYPEFFPQVYVDGELITQLS